MGEVRAALAIARKDLRVLARYRVAVVAMVFTPLYQGVIPAFLFGTAFAVGGRFVGLEETVGTANLAGFIFLGGVISGLVGTAFWAMAMGLRNEMDNGTLEPSWLTPTRRDSFLVGRAIGGMVMFAFSQVALFVIGIAFFGLRFEGNIAAALPAVVVAVVAMVGVAYFLAAAVLLMREANFFIDTTNFLFAVASGVAFPITLLPGAFQAVALLLPTTYAVDILRHVSIGARPLFDPVLEHVALVATALILFPVGRRAFGAAEHRMRRDGTLAQH
jgi:ABC-type polysaccharide/polyol phosphate export permease